MNNELTCTDCRNVFFGSSVFGNGLGVCNVCRASNEAAKRFEKESAQRERQYNQSYRSEYSPTTSAPNPNEGFILIGMFIGAIAGSWPFHVILGLDFNILLAIIVSPVGSVIGGFIAKSIVE